MLRSGSGSIWDQVRLQDWLDQIGVRTPSQACVGASLTHSGALDVSVSYQSGRSSRPSRPRMDRRNHVPRISSLCLRLHHDQTKEGSQQVNCLSQEQPISASSCIQLAFDPAANAEVHGWTTAAATADRGGAANDPGLETRKTQQWQARGLEIWRQVSQTHRQSGPSRPAPSGGHQPGAQWPSGSAGSLLPRTTQRPRSHALYASRLQATALPPRPDPSSLINHDPVIISPPLSPSSNLLSSLFTPIHIHPQQQWPVRACFLSGPPSTSRRATVTPGNRGMPPRVEVVYAFLCGPDTPMY